MNLHLHNQKNNETHLHNTGEQDIKTIFIKTVLMSFLDLSFVYEKKKGKPKIVFLDENDKTN